MRYLILLTAFISFAFVTAEKINPKPLRMPYKKAGMTEKEAATHLLNRLTFGPTPGEVEKVMSMGLDQWVMAQLNHSAPDIQLKEKLKRINALELSNEQISGTYLNAVQVIRQLQQSGKLSKDSIPNTEDTAYRKKIQELMVASGLKPPRELNRQLFAQKIIRGIEAENQLTEILTDFWFNHFNVSITKNLAQPYVLTYERDAIRPNVLANFETLLKATAQHPAMLLYLDNALSGSDNNPLQERARARMTKQNSKRRQNGLNENYARELLELHTLGVDGGYTQQDVQSVAKALTGWTVRPFRQENMGGLAKQVNRRQNLAVVENDFMFLAFRHDETEKTILNKKYPANGGYTEGLEVLHQLASHPSTAQFICKKLAARFVADEPPAKLVSEMAKTFLATSGNIKAVLITMLNAPEFWDKKYIGIKTKSPFEFTVSAVRITNARVIQPFQLYNWCEKMGQQLYGCSAPTGFPDKASFWINSGSLLNRVNFGVSLVENKIPGIRVPDVAKDMGLQLGSPSFQNK
jgi:uncharacterized protein (DUF1800 family)